MRPLRFLSVLLVGLFSVCLFFRMQVLSGFQQLPGDIWDGRLIFGIMEHWRLVFHGDMPWRTMAMFWPAEGSLGFSDTLFLPAVIHAGLCGLGLPPYLSFTLSLMLIALAGFGMMYCLLHRFIGLHWIFSALLAAVFINIAPMYSAVSYSHMQLMLAWLAPGVILLLWKAVESKNHPLLWAILCGLYLGALFLSAYYPSWFLTLYLCIALLIQLLRLCLRTRRDQAEKGVLFSIHILFLKEPALKILQWARMHRRTILVFAIAFLLALIPFFMVYIPALRQTGSHSFNNVRMSLPWVFDYVNVGDRNILWGWTLKLRNIAGRDYNSELCLGLPPVTMLVFIAALVHMLRMRGKGIALPKEAKVALLAGAGVLVCWALMLKVASIGGWLLVFTLVPGAEAIRAIFRFNIVLSMFVLLVCAAYFKTLLARGTRRTAILVSALCLVMLAEQIPCQKAENYTFTRESLDSLIRDTPPPPPDATAFYVRRSGLNPTWVSVSALLLAQHYHLRTVNGYSGTWPKKWELGDTNAFEYERNVQKWLGEKVPDHFYALDMETGEWMPGSILTRPIPFKYGSDDIVSSGMIAAYREEGWSNPESWGIWTESPVATLSIPLLKKSDKALDLTIQMHGYITAKYPRQRARLFVDGKLASEWEIVFPAKTVEIHAVVPPEDTLDKKLDLRFELPDAVSPAELGLGNDPRKLGVGLHSMKLNYAD